VLANGSCVACPSNATWYYDYSCGCYYGMYWYITNNTCSCLGNQVIINANSYPSCGCNQTNFTLVNITCIYCNASYNASYNTTSNTCGCNNYTFSWILSQYCNVSVICTGN
jgi:hypothetical protein